MAFTPLTTASSPKPSWLLGPQIPAPMSDCSGRTGTPLVTPLPVTFPECTSQRAYPQRRRLEPLGCAVGAPSMTAKSETAQAPIGKPSSRIRQRPAPRGKRSRPSSLKASGAHSDDAQGPIEKCHGRKARRPPTL